MSRSEVELGGASIGVVRLVLCRQTGRAGVSGDFLNFEWNLVISRRQSSYGLELLHDNRPGLILSGSRPWLRLSYRARVRVSLQLRVGAARYRLRR